ncbi:hypothetical protein P280DRAFT_126957 [Massarina eburnea CBS 473.64]|uniref:Ribonuclease P/MRP protein subunit POP5 n=1 Tax=Massarina eburnea CBS 473.64 TaxID=1395130 RepID=A0A6A6SHH5_9PLEO|nr:hypothetical protein P280DRAFT_126957 [Massarina eburnea CBS 473.64]
MVRVKNRYLVVNFLYPGSTPTAPSKPGIPNLVQFHAPTPDAFHTGHLLRIIRDGVQELFGDYGAGMVHNALKVNYWSPATSTAIIRCPRENYEMVWAALTFVRKLPKPLDVPVVIKVVRVSGTIRKAEEEVIRRAKLIMRRAKGANVAGGDKILESVVEAVQQRRETEVLAQVDEAGASGDESEDGSE